MNDFRNIAEAHRRQAERLGPQVAVRYKRGGLWKDLTWSDYRAEVLACAAGLIEAGLQPSDRVGVLGENCVEWMIADLGILAAGGVTVTPHSALSARQIQFQMHDAGARWLFVSTAAQCDKVRQVRHELPALEGVFAFDPAASYAEVESWDDFLRRGRQAISRYTAELARRETALGPSELATIMYTSGTTGNPKGVMLSHSNILSNVAQCLEAEPILQNDVILCWLPLSHIFARVCDFYEHVVSGTLLCLSTSVETVVADIAEVQPTRISCVPRFYEKLLASVGSPDPAVTSARLRKVFGPRIRFLGAGGAPLPWPIEQALRAAGLPIQPGYGLTESSPVLSFNLTRRSKPGTAGLVLPGVEIRIAPDGEVLARGPNIMCGYWKNPEATAEAITDGWLHTGDLGMLDADGFLTITGRKKELMVLSNGKKVIPTYLEGLLVADDCIDQAVVYGEGRHYVTALLVPHWDNLRRAVAHSGQRVPDSATEDELVGHPAIREELRRRVSSRLADVAGYEQVKKFHILARPFTVETGELTVSLKMRRGVIFARYQAELESLYRE
ncbi:MAG TPA: AMP-dependent synthetase/ligase [Pirellulales bacterium]|jgi:long-chain acyl-CoA synthetase|nr:AMP-dependent synthetase/ligase [Pirellulales bacterium]